MSHSKKLLILILSSAVLLSACSKREEPDPRTGPALVRVAVAGNVAGAQRVFSGVVSARVQSELGFRVPGKIVERLVDIGQTVRKGQPLMRIDRTDLALATAVSIGAVDAAKAKAIQTAADEKRYRGLVAAGAVSASAYDQAKAAAEAADAQLKAAQAQSNVSENEAGYSVLLADSDGVVVDTLAEPGQVVAAGQTVVRLAHSGPREATISLPETLRPEVGSSAKATLYNDPSVVGSAKLRQLSDSADLRTRTFEARYVLEGPAAASPLGMTVMISLPDTRAGSGMQIPLGAIFDSGKGPGVWIVEGAQPHVKWRAVKLANLGEETASVTEGLSGGERFVALGAHLLHQDQAVRVDGQQGGTP